MTNTKDVMFGIATILMIISATIVNIYNPLYGYAGPVNVIALFIAVILFTVSCPFL